MMAKDAAGSHVKNSAASAGWKNLSAKQAQEAAFFLASMNGEEENGSK
jgi:hypothetical protein